MDKHEKKMIAPIIITIVFITYFISFFTACAFIPMPLFVKLLLGLIPLALLGICIYVLIERLKEIRSGEEDDLSQY